MTPDMKTKWLAALRSGDYIQATHQLKSPENGYCCLGVLCDVHDPTLWIDVEGVDPKYIRETDVLPAQLAANYEIDESLQRELIFMNDDKEYTFEQIADWIEDNL